MLRPSSPLAVTFAGGGVYPELVPSGVEGRSRRARNTADTVQIHINTILTARQTFTDPPKA